MNYPFRSSAFGGFNKQDVMTFLDAQSQQLGTSQQKLQEQLDTARQELDALRQERDELTCQLEDLRQEAEADERRQSDASALLEQIKQERDAANAQLDQLTQERDELRLQLEAAQADAQAYAELKDRTARVELDAHRRAQCILDEAEQDAQKTRRQAEEWLLKTESEYDAICRQVKDTVSKAAGQLEKAGEELEQLNAVMNSQSDALEGLRCVCTGTEPSRAETPAPTEGE